MNLVRLANKKGSGLIIDGGAAHPYDRRMPRPHRVTPAGYCDHVLNRSNARQRAFHKDADYAAFLNLFDEAHRGDSQMYSRPVMIRIEVHSPIRCAAPE